MTLRLLFADWTAPVGAIGGAIAAIAAVVAIWYAKQAAVAGRDALREAHQLRVEEDFRELGRALTDLQRFADDARQTPGATTINDMHHAQTRVRGLLVTPVRVKLADDALNRLDRALGYDSDPRLVFRMASFLIDDVQKAYDAQAAAPKEITPGWPPVDGAFGARPPKPPGQGA
ncbi:MAG: hypothetical protein JOY58_19525 [Solirubrobacterales bacterium]|nr:hypothetical protein [Solirubrobacterales bacterium]